MSDYDISIKKGPIHFSTNNHGLAIAAILTLEGKVTLHGETGEYIADFREPIRHDWDDQDKCRRCGDRDWYASASCTPKQGEPVAQYNRKRIGWELERTAMGDGFYGNALRVAKDFPELSDEDRSVLDRYATGAQRHSDHIALQVIAMKVYAAPQPAEQQPDVTQLVEALRLAKEMFIANDLILPHTFEVIDEALAKARGGEEGEKDE